MFVDDTLFCEIRHLIPQSTATSIEILFLIFSVDEATARDTSFSMDKDFQTHYSYLRIQLGRILNTRTMSVCHTDEKRNNIKKELQH